MGMLLFKRWQAVRLFSNEDAAKYFGISVEMWKLLKERPQSVPSMVLYRVAKMGFNQEELADDLFNIGLTLRGRSMLEAAGPSGPVEVDDEAKVYELRKHSAAARPACKNSAK